MISVKNNQKGSTMMEALAVLAIFVMMGASAIALIASVWGIFRQNLVVNEARDLQKAISDSYKAEGTYERLLQDWADNNVDRYKPAESLCSEKIAPPQMCSNNKLRHRMGGEVFVSPVDSNNNKYMLTFMGLSKKACVALAEINWFTQKQTFLQQMRINFDGTTGTVVCLPGVGENCSSSLTLYNFSTGDAMNSCNKSNGENVVDWIFF